jgi:hypothetical protein
VNAPRFGANIIHTALYAPKWMIYTTNVRKTTIITTMKIRCFYSHDNETENTNLVHERYCDGKGAQIYTKSLFWVCYKCYCRNTVSIEHPDYEELNKISVYK